MTLTHCLIFGMTVLNPGELPYDQEEFGDYHNSMNECQLVGKEWRRKHGCLFEHVWTTCAPRGTSTFKHCEKLDRVLRLEKCE